MEPVCERYPKPWDAEAPWEELTRGQRAVYTLWLVEVSVRQEGFHGFLWNTAGFHLTAAPEAAKLIGADEYADIFEAALDVFPDRTAPVSTPQRREMLQIAGDSGEEFLSGLEDRFHELLDRPSFGLQDYFYEYIASDAGEFFQQDGDVPEEPDRGH